jgi:Na+/H+ antiporter NhaB
MPLCLLALGFSIELALSFAVICTANTTDYILTKTALKIGLKEANPVYNLIKRRVKVDTFLAVGSFGWYFFMAIALFIFRDVALLLLYSLGSFFCVVANSVTLWSFFSDKIDQNHITEPQEANRYSYLPPLRKTSSRQKVNETN